MRPLNFAAVAVTLAVLCTDTASADVERRVVCYYTTWSANRVAPYNLTPDQLDPYLCTHIIYAFADIGSKNNLISSNPEFDFNQRGFANVTGLKTKNKNLKVMIGVGGWNTATLGFVRITSNDTNRREFAKNAVRFLRGFKFDGLDLNWQHPTFREGGTPEDRKNYVLLAQTLREEFEKEASSKNKQKLLLSIAISHHQKFLPAYDIASFSNYMDFISVICYDYHFSYESAVNHHAPLYSLEADDDYNYDAKFNTNYTIHYFSELAAPEKLVLGIPTFGRTYKLEDPSETALGSFADGAGDKGPFTGEKGFFAYFEICNAVMNEGWTVVQTKPGSAGPYAFKGDQWVGYDDITMVKHKADYAVTNKLGGVMFWTVDYDDFLGQCGGGRFPLIRAARDALIQQEEDVEDPNKSDEVVPEVTSETQVRDQELAAVGPDPQIKAQDTEKDSQDIEPLHSQPSLPQLPSLPPGTRLTPPQATLTRDSPGGSDVSVPQSNIVADLIHLIEKAGGVKSFGELLRSEKARNSVKEGYSKEVDDNTLVLESAKLPPLLLIMQNSSIYIKEFNIYHKP